jgi:hypothetical protein
MKNRIWANLRDYFPPQLTQLTYLTAFILPLAGCMKEGAFSSPETTVSAAEASASPQAQEVSETTVEPAADTEEALAEIDEQNISNAPAKKVSTEIQVPANLQPSPATAEIIKLANAGVEENVMLSFVTNSLGTFNLRAEEIIYLNDIGVPSGVVTAMIQRDHLLQGTPSNLTMTSSDADSSVAAPPPAMYPPDAPEISPPVSDSAPLPGYASDTYATPVEPEPPATDSSDYYDSLAPYGNWVDVSGVGRCWQPTVAIVNHGWRPYFNCGRWVYTDCGWYWMSDYSWGWAPFHYGRWFQHAGLGWCWRPDRVWGPSWVCWRQSGDYCGWAPLPPGARFVAGVGLTFHGRLPRHNFSFGLAADHFRFISTSHFLNRDLARHVLSRDDAARIYGHTIASTGIVDHNHRVSNNGIPRDHVASATHANILPVTLHSVTPTEGVGIRERFERNGRTLAVFRPDLQPGTPERIPTVTGRTQVPSINGTASLNSQSRTHIARAQSQAPVIAPSPTSSGRPAAPVRAAQPLILRGANSPRQTALSTNPNPNSQNTRRTVPLNSLIVIGQNRDARVAATQPDNRAPWNSHNRSSSSRDVRNFPAQNLASDDETRQPQTSSQSTWWAQPHQPRNSQQEQYRHNREIHPANNWNATVESPRHSPMQVQVPEHTRSAPVETRQHSSPDPIESRPVHSVPMESHTSRPAPVESHASHSASAPSSPSPSSSSSSSSGRGR